MNLVLNIPYTTREDIRRASNFFNYLINKNYNAVTKLKKTLDNFEYLNCIVCLQCEEEKDEVQNMLNLTVFYDSILEMR